MVLPTPIFAIINPKAIITILIGIILAAPIINIAKFTLRILNMTTIFFFENLYKVLQFIF